MKNSTKLPLGGNTNDSCLYEYELRTEEGRLHGCIHKGCRGLCIAEIDPYKIRGEDFNPHIRAGCPLYECKQSAFVSSSNNLVDMIISHMGGCQAVYTEDENQKSLLAEKAKDTKDRLTKYFEIPYLFITG